MKWNVLKLNLILVITSMAANLFADTSYIVSQYWTWHTAGASAPHWSNYTYYGEPALGYYSSHDPNIAASHINQMLANGINVLSVAYVNKAGDGAMWEGLDPDQAFQDGVMQASNFADIKFAISYDLATRALMTHVCENGYQWGYPGGLDVLPWVQFTDPAIGNGSGYPSFNFNLQDGYGFYIYDELLMHDFKHFAATYFNQPNYLKINGQCVVFLYDSWRYNNGGVGGVADGFGRAFNNVRTNIYNWFGYKVYLVGDFVKWNEYAVGHQNYYRDYGFYQHYDAVSSWNVADGPYYDNIGALTSLATYTTESQKVHNAFRPAAMSATRNYRQWLPEPAKTAYGSSSVPVDFIPLLSYSFRAGDGSFGFWSSVSNDSQVLAQAQMVKNQRDLSLLAEADAEIVYNVAFNQWGEGQIMETTVSGTPTYPGFYEWTYLGVTKGILERNYQATSPVPSDGASGISITPLLSWSAGFGADTHDVYFGVSEANVTSANHNSSEYIGNQAGVTYAPATLGLNTRYYWRIDEVSGGSTVKGAVWSFTTTASVPPTFVAAGTVASGTGTITPSLPSSIVTGDILLLFLETSNQPISISNQNGGTWIQVAGSPQYCGTAASTTGARLTAFWSRYNGVQGAPTTTDSGDHQLGRIIAIRGAVSSGDPWNVTAGGIEAVSDTSGAIPGATTTVANTLVVTVIATSLPDASSTAKFSAWTNSSLTSVIERTDNSVTAGNGGGLAIATGIKGTAGSYGNTTVTLANSAYKGMMSIAIKP